LYQYTRTSWCHFSSIKYSLYWNKQTDWRKILPEFRIGTDNFFEDTAFELNINYLFIKKEDLEIYSGLVGRVLIFEGLVIPLGVIYYLFENKNFGFHIDMAGIIA